ncbi:MAG: hypothetical protein MUF78_07905 [Candidatus Edwardsbacteria bacterium]|nr:hypothetical protein [Candidatus Edwardsbacteria bacterium]
MRCLPLLALLALAAVPRPARAGYRLDLPLQYNAFHPVSARALGCGDCWAALTGLAPVFANPAALAGGPGPAAEAGGSAVSAFRSHEILGTRASLAVPATLIAGWGAGGQCLAFGARRAQRATLDFDDPRRPQVVERLELNHDQLRGAWRIAAGGSARVGLALGFDRLTMDWADTSHRLAQAAVNSQGFALGCEADVRRDLTLGLFYRARTTFEGSTGFDYLDTLRTLELYSIVPSAAGLTARWQIDSGFAAAGQVEFTAWQAAIDGYVGTLDWHAGLELSVAPWLTLRAGGHSLVSPIDPADRDRHPELHGLYFLTAGAGLRWRRLAADLGAATSHPLSGSGNNQNIVAFSLGYAHRPPAAAAPPAPRPEDRPVPEPHDQPSEETGQ